MAGVPPAGKIETSPHPSRRARTLYRLTDRFQKPNVKLGNMTNSIFWEPRSEANRWNTRDRLGIEGRLDEFLHKLRKAWADGSDLTPGRLVNRCPAEIWYKMLAGYAPLPREDVETRNHQPTDDWPFWITEDNARKQVAAGIGREASYDVEVMWVADNIGNADATPAAAPSNASWRLLLMSCADKAQMRQFFQQHYAKVRGGDDDSTEKDRRTRSIDIESVLGRFESWRKCPHCGEEIH